MNGQFYIDAIDIPDTYGIFIAGYDGILSFPQMKEPDKNDWAEQDGLEVDLLDPKLKSKEFEISFGTINKNADIDGLINLIIDGAFHSFEFTDLGINRLLRLVDSKKFVGTILELRLFTLTFSDDFPLGGYSYLEPVSNWFPQQGYRIDQKDLSAYGIAVLEGTDAQIMKLPAIKKNLSVDSISENGVVFDSQRVKFQAKDVKLNLLMRANTPAEFVRNYNAFLYDLVRPNEREFYFSKNAGNYRCYYKNSEVGNILIGTDIWCKFSVTLCFVAYRAKRYLYLMNISGKLVVADTPYIKNQGIDLFITIEIGVPIPDVLTMSATYSAGQITINVHSEAKEVVLNYSNGELTIT